MTEHRAQQSDLLLVISGDLALLECPACGESLNDPADPPADHKGVADHIATHSPEDFGLSRLGDRATGGGGDRGAMRA